MYTADTDSKYIWSAQTTFDGVPLITLRNTDGEWLAQELKSHPEIKLTFSQEQKAFPMVHPGKPSPFSSYGISPDLDLKPDIAAPGAKILSTFPLNFGGWAQDQGTSMACPYVAGAVALLLEKYGKMPTSAIRSLLLNTADPMTMDDRQIYPVPKQGSGLLNIIDALNVRTLITPTKYALNNDSKLTAIDERQNFTIYNMAPTTVKYAISHLPAASLTGYNGSDPRPLSTVTLSNVTATITFAVTSVTIPPNGHAVVNWNIQPPNLDPAGHWFYSGFIYVKPDSDEGVQTIPYAAVLTTGLVNVLSQEQGYPSLQYPKNNSTTISASSADDTISLKLFTDNPTRLLLVGVLSEDNETDYGCALYLSYFARTAQPIPITFYPFEVGTCDSEQQSELLPNGNYRLYVSAVKMFGNLARTEDYEVWISPPFTIERVNETSTDVLPTFTDVLPTSTDVLPTSTDALPVPSPTASDPHSNK
ncbi:hypothetical protein BC936DRAFT_143229 [Jimgerdemannia flammicorona]|uniref:Peptidase S8/S53 domain-containing protein n=1 Tax=Jimgerdemannia flammicorona TaxID=994334 RepID=A0A433DE63_9FUNG|nr:hypothetical protein BC936DRAFT_143229 [Jimgerdemannia flammicorona]